MYCPSCSVENKTNDFCEQCNTNLVVIRQFLLRADAKAKRSKLLSRSGLVSITISEGFAWTLSALAIFMIVIFLASFFLSKNDDNNTQTYMAFAILIALIAFCGIPLLFGLVLLLKDITEVKLKKTSLNNQEKEN
jgi:Na+/proline symporter